MKISKAARIVSSLKLDYPVIIVSYADWRGGCQVDMEYGTRAEDILENGAGDFNYVEFVAENPDELAHGLAKNTSFVDIYDRDTYEEITILLADFFTEG